MEFLEKEMSVNEKIDYCLKNVCPVCSAPEYDDLRDTEDGCFCMHYHDYVIEEKENSRFRIEDIDGRVLIYLPYNAGFSRKEVLKFIEYPDLNFNSFLFDMESDGTAPLPGAFAKVEIEK